MTRHFPPPVTPSAISAMLVDAARSWRRSRDDGRSVQPVLAKALAAHRCEMLAPVLDSLCLFYEVALGRPIRTGEASTLSDDEQLLLGLLNGSTARRCMNCPQRAANALDCALCSTRIMLALTIGRPGEGTMW